MEQIYFEFDPEPGQTMITIWIQDHLRHSSRELYGTYR